MTPKRNGHGRYTLRQAAEDLLARPILTLEQVNECIPPTCPQPDRQRRENMRKFAGFTHMAAALLKDTAAALGKEDEADAASIRQIAQVTSEIPGLVQQVAQRHQLPNDQMHIVRSLAATPREPGTFARLSVLVEELADESQAFAEHLKAQGPKAVEKAIQVATKTGEIDFDDNPDLNYFNGLIAGIEGEVASMRKRAEHMKLIQSRINETLGRALSQNRAI